MIEKIVVHERDMEMVHTSPQKVEVHLNFIGEFVIPGMETESEPTAEEIAIEERRAKDRERYRRNYLKRREQGYYDKSDKGKTAKAETLKTKPPKTKTVNADVPLAMSQ